MIAKQSIQMAMCLASLLFAKLNLNGEGENKSKLNVRDEIDRIKKYFVKLKEASEQAKIRINKDASERVIFHNLSHKKSKLE